MLQTTPAGWSHPPRIVSKPCLGNKSWLTEQIDDAVLEIESNFLVRRDRRERIGGGIYEFKRTNKPFKIQDDLHDNCSKTL